MPSAPIYITAAVWYLLKYINLFLVLYINGVDKRAQEVFNGCMFLSCRDRINRGVAVNVTHTGAGKHSLGANPDFIRHSLRLKGLEGMEVTR